MISPKKKMCKRAVVATYKILFLTNPNTFLILTMLANEVYNRKVLRHTLEYIFQKLPPLQVCIPKKRQRPVIQNFLTLFLLCNRDSLWFENNKIQSRNTVHFCYCIVVFLVVTIRFLPSDSAWRNPWLVKKILL